MACTGTGDGFMKEMVDILRSYARWGGTVCNSLLSLSCEWQICVFVCVCTLLQHL
jgi:hypothetical protein